MGSITIAIHYFILSSYYNTDLQYQQPFNQLLPENTYVYSFWKFFTQSSISGATKRPTAKVLKFSDTEYPLWHSKHLFITLF